jgi:hypothetical protein
MTGADEIIAEIEASRPPGYFNGERGLLLHFVELRVAIRDLHGRLMWTRPARGVHVRSPPSFAPSPSGSWELAGTLHQRPMRRQAGR